MFSLAYTLPLDLRSRLARLSVLRESILVIPLSAAKEHIVRFETSQECIRASLALSGIRVRKEDRSPATIGYKKALDRISDEWVATTKSVRFTSVVELARSVYVGPLSHHMRIFGTFQQPIEKLLNYLETQEEQPVIQAAVSLGFLSASILPTGDPGLVPRLLSRLFLSKHGYDIRGLVAPERQWSANESSYRNALTGSAKRQNMTEWILFYVESLIHEYSQSLKNLESANELPASLRLTDRQQTILHLLDDPTKSITNREIQKRFRISQITSSRELTRLTILGLLAVHGKGRSVSYSRI